MIIPIISNIVFGLLTGALLFTVVMISKRLGGSGEGWLLRWLQQVVLWTLAIHFILTSYIGDYLLGLLLSSYL